jgi:ferredoxin
MKEGYITKAAWPSFVAALAARCPVYAPCEDEETVLFRQIGEATAVCLDRPAHGAPKGVIFPQSETLFTFSFDKDPDAPQKTRVSLDVEQAPRDAVILAGRPCDARGFTILDRVFLEADPYYRERRERTTVVTLACSKGFAGCFCTSVGGGPADKTGSDALITGLEDGYYIEILTEKGARTLADLKPEDGAPYRGEVKQRHDDAAALVAAAGGGSVRTKVRPELFASDEFWQETAERCLACGACTYLCPTCQCFNITDEQGTTSGERIRSWDSCMFTHFTLEASGHNPRSRKAQRLKNRVGHKFIWNPEVHDDPACTGCGRCVRHCPVSIDIGRIVTLLSGSVGADREETHGAA